MEQPVINRAIRIDHAVQRWRARRVRDAGYTAEVIPYTSYGSTSWLRVLARVLLAKSTSATPIRRPGYAAGVTSSASRSKTRT